MQWVAKAVQYYKDINPATLTGAIDVIVVERPSEDGAGTELACSPFHVRFGKLSVLRPIDKKVRITVNDQEIPFYMKVGETGEAFFVFETDADVPENLQTSPIAAPIQDDELQEGDHAPGEPEYLDLNAPSGEETQPGTEFSSPTSSVHASMTQTQVNSPTMTLKPLPPVSPSLHTASRHDYNASSRAHRGASRVAKDMDGEEAEDPGQEEEGMDNDDEAEAEEADEVDLAADARAKPKKKERFTDSDHHETAKAKSASYVPAVVQHAVEKVAGIGGIALTGVAGGKKLKDAVKNDGRSSGQGLSRGQASEDLEGGLRGENESGQLTELEKEMKQDLEGANVIAESEPGDDVADAARRHDSDVRELLGGRSGTGRARSVLGKTTQEYSLKKSETGEAEVDVDGLRDHSGTGPHPERAGDLMLDMSGYKLDDASTINASDSVAEGETSDGEPREDVINALDEKAQEEMVAFTQSLLQSTDPKTLRNFFDPSDDQSSRAASPEPSDENETTAPSSPDFKARHIRSYSRASSPVPSSSMSISSLQSLAADSADSDAASLTQASPRQFTLKVGSKVHVFELSLCGTEAFGQDRAADEHAFAEHQVTFTQFMEHESVADHSDLVVKYGGRYLTWSNASPVLASLAVYRKSLVDHPEHHPSLESGAKSGRRGWSSWWRGSRDRSTTSLPVKESPDGAPTSPPISPPDSPRSLPARLDSPTPSSPALSASGDNATSAPGPVTGPEGGNNSGKHYAKTLRLTSEQLKELGLKKGMNEISFSVRSSYSGYATCSSRVFLWDSDHSVVISDIDGTITKSDALGHVFTMIGRDWTHLGVAKLYTDIARNGYKMMYLTSRAIGQADTTREYLKGIAQNNFKLPDGPVIMSPDRLMTSLHREVVLRKPEVFKMACLRDIQRLFHERSPFYAGFGNRITDALSYRSVDVPSSRIFTIDSNGEVKMELLELAGYKSSYIHMTDLVDQMFPPINRKTQPDFTDFNYWRTPMATIDLPDLSPPSPALSARSGDSSRLAFPRLGSIASSLSRRSSRPTLTTDGATTPNGTNRSVRSGTPSSPLLQATLVEEPFNLNGEYVGDDDDGQRSESESMPGSLPNDGDFERLRREALRLAEQKNGTRTPAEAYKEKVKGSSRGAERDDDEEEEEEEEESEEDDDDEGEQGDFDDQLDFSSVPYL
ncbi:BZ3500_MvSof-1268-A1-R1_Chr1-2g01360 [Microbotryum saponariae]|uniref:phosphatidate phosphatase n=1 Tax=Microbotryum saponariae TaxID=289078 RepID=A0A2X0LLW7_9BASI|nr:BZ3500_MvSof-1268-A1-R1_Chr1-2g01360 [Microbotryum saponariae]SCZ97203.1 BZ3501_MvSof-1269-A2-R1_Chr1-2g00959 [Microbotryum saponariae]